MMANYNALKGLFPLVSLITEQEINTHNINTFK